MNRISATSAAGEVTRSPRTRSARLALAVTTVTALLGLAVATGAPATAAETTVDGTLNTSTQASASVSVPVAEGLVPQSVVGRLLVGPSVTGAVTFSVGQRTVLRVDAPRTGTLAVPVRPSDLSGGRTLDLRMTYAVTEACPSGSATAPVVFDQLRLRYAGTETMPTSIDTFFPAATPRVDVVVPNGATDDVLAAALTAVAALSDRYSRGTSVVLSAADRVLPRAGVGQRVVRIESGPPTVTTEVETRFGLPTLTLTGAGDALRDAAQALGSDRLALAIGSTTTGLAERLGTREVSLDKTLADLDASTIELTGPAPASRTIGVRQDAFGGPIDSLHITIQGTHTVPPAGTQAQLNTYFNGYLLDSQMLDDDPLLDVDVEVPASRITADNGIELRLTTADGRTGCDGPSTLPVEVYVDGSQSTVSATRGTGDTTGFKLFPQALGGTLPVALRGSGTERLQDAIDASYLVRALQRNAAGPLSVSLVQADSFVAGSQSGLLIGATKSDSDALKAPLRLDGMRLIDAAESDFQVGTDQPYSTLEAIHTDGRHVLMLGSWSGDADTDLAALDRETAVHVATVGWGSLNDDVLVMSEGADVFTISSDYIVPQADTVEEKSGFIWWILGGLALLLVLLVLQVTRTSRRDRRVRELVDAQVQADRSGQGGYDYDQHDRPYDQSSDDDDHPRP